MKEEEKRTYTIPHNIYDDSGKLVKVVDKQFTTNETDTHIYITSEWLKQFAHRIGVNTTVSADYKGYEKEVMFEDDNKSIPLYSLIMERKGDLVDIHLVTESGKISFAIPVM